MRGRAVYLLPPPGRRARPGGDPSLRRAYRRGVRAAREGVVFDSNPYAGRVTPRSGFLPTWNELAAAWSGGWRSWHDARLPQLELFR